MRAITEGMRCIRPPSGTRRKPDRNWKWVEESRQYFVFKNQFKCPVHAFIFGSKSIELKSKKIVLNAKLYQRQSRIMIAYCLV